MLDKTGTITEGKPAVTDLVLAGAESGDELIRLAASLEKPSEHPLSQALIAESEKRRLVLRPVTGFETLPGRGIRGTVGGEIAAAGNRKLMEEMGIPLGRALPPPKSWRKTARPPIYFAKGGHLFGIAAVADPVRPTSAAAIAALRKMGVEVIMLTGDNRKTAEAIGRKLQLSSVIAEVLRRIRRPRSKS